MEISYCVEIALHFHTFDHGWQSMAASLPEQTATREAPRTDQHRQGRNLKGETVWSHELGADRSGPIRCDRLWLDLREAAARSGNRWDTV